MSEIVLVILVSTVVSIAMGLLIGTVLYKRKTQKTQEETIEKSKLIIKEAEIAAENLKKDKIIEAKEKNPQNEE